MFPDENERIGDATTGGPARTDARGAALAGDRASRRTPCAAGGYGRSRFALRGARGPGPRSVPGNRGDSTGAPSWLPARGGGPLVADLLRNLRNQVEHDRCMAATAPAGRRLLSVSLRQSDASGRG